MYLAYGNCVLREISMVWKGTCGLREHLKNDGIQKMTKRFGFEAVANLQKCKCFRFLENTTLSGVLWCLPDRK